MKNLISFGILLIFQLLLLLDCAKRDKSISFTSDWPSGCERVWIGPEYWANRLQDWQIANGRLECRTPGTDRNIHLLTHQLSRRNGEFEMRVQLGGIRTTLPVEDAAWIGFLVGVKGQFDDYRDSAVHGKGIPMGITTMGKLFIANVDTTRPELPTSLLESGIELRVTGKPLAAGYRLKLAALNPENHEILGAVETDTITSQALSGNLALSCHYPKPGKVPETMVAWFDNWKISGTKIAYHPGQTFGPVLFAQYTLSKNILKLTAQMPPIGPADGQEVILSIQKADSSTFEQIACAPIDPLSRTATFRIENWDNSKHTPYILMYDLFTGANELKRYYFTGEIRKEPVEKNEIVVAGFTGNNDLGFPNTELVEAVKFHNPDMLFFSGDQIYEGVGGYGVQYEPLENAVFEYLRKWYIYGWAYNILLRDRPSVSIPDDHDVFHGNLWGEGGKKAERKETHHDWQDAGGYKMPPEFVKMVERTQTSHLPDPYDPTPIQHGLGVYYCDFNYAGISFAVIEDRKFKSAPKSLLPKAKIWNGWPQNPEFNAKREADVPGAHLIGERQLNFLSDWAGDWRHQTWMKVVLSQTIFANVATLPDGGPTDAIVPKLKVFQPDEYPENDLPVTDMDSNGWPQSERNATLHEMRKAFAFHLAGDQHLGSTLRYGIEDWNDAGFAFCVPAISNIWPRRWFPCTPGANRPPNSPEYTGDFEDGFGNKITVHAVSNPYFTGKEPAILYDRATGYGIVRFRKNTRDIIVECWPRWVDPVKPSAAQYAGWPIQFNQLDNYGRKAIAYLPTIKVTGLENPVVQLIDKATNEIVYALRINGTEFKPKVFTRSTYELRIGEPDSNNFQILKNIKPLAEGASAILEVKF
ncbi:alkaline phosphatase D family protein [candidate division KSB1 bacterium]|nr:alkaline phosphatase D family protein [candidate division KSB1 bacterium]